VFAADAAHESAAGEANVSNVECAVHGLSGRPVVDCVAAL
jgi:hypothetical protein